MACDALAARFTRAWSANADPPTIALHLKPWRGRSRTRRTTFSRRRAVFLIGATRHDPQSVIRQWPLQGVGRQAEFTRTKETHSCLQIRS